MILQALKMPLSNHYNFDNQKFSILEFYRLEPIAIIELNAPFAISSLSLWSAGAIFRLILSGGELKAADDGRLMSCPSRKRGASPWSETRVNYKNIKLVPLCIKGIRWIGARLAGWLTWEPSGCVWLIGSTLGDKIRREVERGRKERKQLSSNTACDIKR